MARREKIKNGEVVQSISRGKPRVRRMRDGRYQTIIKPIPDGPTATLVIFPEGENLREKRKKRPQ